MKKLIAVLLALALVLALAACGDKNEKPEPTDDTVASEPQQTEPAGQLPSFSFTQYGNAKITIVGAEFIKNDWDDDVLRIYYDYTNTGDSACGQYPGLALDFKSITQDGQECDNIWFGILDECAIPEDLLYDCPVQPGCTSRQTMLIKCNPNGGVVEVSCYIMIGNWMYDPDTIELLTFQIDPKNLMGVPEPLEMAAIMNPTYAVGLPTSGTNDDPDNSEISIDGWELTTGDKGENVLRVKLTVTNNGEEAKMPVNITNGVEAYQDGLGLLWFSEWDLEEPTAEDAAYNEDLDPGETVQCNALFLLRNDHPVEIVVEELYSDLRLGMVGDVKAAMEAIEADKEAQQQAANAAEAAARAALVGVWLERDSDWDNTYYFNADGTGLLISGPEYPFTYALNGTVLTLTYGEDDSESFTITVDGNLLTMIDQFGYEILLDKAESEPSEPSTEPTEPVTEPTVALADSLIGTWVCETDGETYAFNEDGTGYQIYEGVTYGYTYKITDNYVEILYDEGSTDAFEIEIDGDTLIIAYYWTYTRQ